MGPKYRLDPLQELAEGGFAPVAAPEDEEELLESYWSGDEEIELEEDDQ